MGGGKNVPSQPNYPTSSFFSRLESPISPLWGIICIFYDIVFLGDAVVLLLKSIEYSQIVIKRYGGEA